MTVRATDADRRKDVAIVVEGQVVRVVSAVAVRRCRPIEAVASDIVQTAIVAAAITRSRIPDSLI